MTPKLISSRNRLLDPRVYLLILLLLSLVAAGACTPADSLPARDWNPVNLQQIKAAPSPTLTFAVLADNRGNPAVFDQLLRQIDRDPDLSFAVHLGDMVEQADLGQYRLFFQEVRHNLHKPLVAVIGNHELYGKNVDGLKMYRDLFGPNYFAFQIDGNYFIAIDDNGKTGLDEEQWQWLEQELQKAQSFRARIIFLHKPLFDPEPDSKHPSGLAPESANRLAELFKKYQVTYIFAAHKHGYFAGQWDQLPYVITAGAGAPLYGTDPRHYFFHYLKVSITGGKVEFQVHRLKD